MHDVAGLRFRRFRSLAWAGALLSAVLLWCGCTPSTTTKKEGPSSTAVTAGEADARTLRNLQSAVAVLQPEKLGIASGPEQAIAVLNEWIKGAQREAEKNGQRWETYQPHRLLQSLPKEWTDQVSLAQFVERDAAFLRDCFWASKAVKFAAGNAEKDLDIVVNLFDYVVRNVALIAPGSRQIPLGPFDVMVVGRGTAADRAWIFAELLRQKNIDAVILSPRRVSGDAGDDGRFLVGVLFGKDILLFDPTLGMPLPADVAEPQTTLPRLPLTLRQVQRDPGLLTAIARDSGGGFSLTAAILEASQVELICHSEQLSSRMQHLQQELAGEQSAVVSDPLADTEDQAGLWSRVAKHPAATWSAAEVAIWSYPEATRAAAARMTPEQQKELLKLTQSLGAPIRVQRFVMNEAAKRADLEFTKPQRALMRRRLEHVMGQWGEAVPGYLAAQLYEVDPPTAKGLEQVSEDRKNRQDVAVVGAVATQNLRLMLMQPQYAHVRKLHLQAGDDACFWLAQCQFEQNRWRAVVDQCRVYGDQHSNGAWVTANQTLFAAALVKQKKLKEAIRVLQAIEKDDPSAGGNHVLVARWQRLLEAAE